jgi:hypothetical protein
MVPPGSNIVSALAVSAMAPLPMKKATTSTIVLNELEKKEESRVCVLEVMYGQRTRRTKHSRSTLEANDFVRSEHHRVRPVYEQFFVG